MFKLTKASGLRRSARSTSSGSGRISGLHGLRGADISQSQRRRPAFVPDTPEEQGYDSNTSRVDEKA